MRRFMSAVNVRLFQRKSFIATRRSDVDELML